MVNVGGRARCYGQLQTTRNKRKRGSLSQSFVFYHHRQSIRCLVNLCFTAFNYIDLIDMSTKITFNKQNSANADYVINLIYNNHDTNVAINSFKGNSGLC